MPLTDQQIALSLELNKALVAVYSPEAVILFGSLARGDADEFSDVDLLVVMETNRDTWELGKEMGARFDPITKDKHIIVKTPRDFCRQVDIPGTIVFSAARDGRILFEKSGWRDCHGFVDPYETRKQEVIRQDYVRSADDFISKAESALQMGSFFRSRDFARFAAAKAIKGLFVKHDIHPPRGTDLVELMEQAVEFEPDLAEHMGFIRGLNGYCPAKADAQESRRCSRIVVRTAAFVEAINA